MHWKRVAIEKYIVLDITAIDDGSEIRVDVMKILKSDAQSNPLN